MPLSLSQRATRTVQSEIRAMSVACENVKGINLAQGVCDTEVPEEVREGARHAIDHGINSYTRAEGLSPIRQAIAQKMRSFNGVECDPETEVVVNSGSTAAFYCACLALLNPGDEVILFEPYYGYHLNTLAILINSPANPSGKVFSQEELEWIAGFAKRHNLFVFTDEIYEYFVYEGRHISMATLPGMRERTITMSGYSKTFSITGWRVGYTVCDRKWAQGISYFHDLIYVCAPAPLQIGVAEGISKLPKSFYDPISQEYVQKRDLLCNTLTEIGLTPSLPKGAYYVLADASMLPGKTSRDKALYLLDQTSVATVAGSAFYHGSDGDNLIRFCYAKTDAELQGAGRRLKARCQRPEAKRGNPMAAMNQTGH